MLLVFFLEIFNLPKNLNTTTNDIIFEGTVRFFVDSYIFMLENIINFLKPRISYLKLIQQTMVVMLIKKVTKNYA